jgi:hypothetical protein
VISEGAASFFQKAATFEKNDARFFKKQPPFWKGSFRHLKTWYGTEAKAIALANKQSCKKRGEAQEKIT